MKRIINIAVLQMYDPFIKKWVNYWGDARMLYRMDRSNDQSRNIEMAKEQIAHSKSKNKFRIIREKLVVKERIKTTSYISSNGIVKAGRS